MNYISKKELYQKINLLENAQDKFMILSIYNGIHGKDLIDLINLKEDDVDLKNKVIKNNNETIHIDETFLKVVEEVLEQKTYYKKFRADFSSLSYNFNPNNIFILKPKPSKLNNYGMNGMTKNALCLRYRGCVELININVTPVDLKNSKITDDLLEIKSNWKLREIKDFFKKYNIDASAHKIFLMVKEVGNLD